MSTRTVIEINHDYVHDLEQHPEYWGSLLRGLRSGAFNAGLNDGDTPNAAPGIRVLGQRHHSQLLKLEVL
jgi:hypothetical protein